MRIKTRELDLLIEVYRHLNAEGGRPDLAAALRRMIDRKAKECDGSYRVVLVLLREQVERDIPYKLICETRYGARWDTLTVKMRWASEFTDDEKQVATGLFTKARNWHLVGGVPDKVRMTESDYDLWLKLGDFCASLGGGPVEAPQEPEADTEPEPDAEGGDEL